MYLFFLDGQMYHSLALDMFAVVHNFTYLGIIMRIWYNKPLFSGRGLLIFLRKKPVIPGMLSMHCCSVLSAGV